MAGATNIGKWSAQASIDTGAFMAGAKQLEDRSKGLEGRLESIFGRMSAGVRMGSGFFLGFDSLSTAGLVQAAKMAFQKVAAVRDEEIGTGFLNDQLDTDIRWLTSLRTVASENMVSTEQFGTAMNRLQNMMGQAAMGGQEAQQAFQALGLRWQDIRDQDFQTSFMQIADAFGQISERGVRARLAMQLFGREGGQRMLRMMGGNLGSMIEDVQARGGFLDAEGMQRMQEMNTAFDKLGTAWAKMWRDFSVNVAPYLTRTIDSIRQIGSLINSVGQGPRPPSGETVEQQRARLTTESRDVERQLQSAEFSQGTGDIIDRALNRNLIEQLRARLGSIGSQLAALDGTLDDSESALFEYYESVDNASSIFDSRLDDLRDQLLGTSSAAGLSGEALRIHQMMLEANSDAQEEAVQQLQQEFEARQRAEQQMVGVIARQEAAVTPLQRMSVNIRDIMDDIFLDAGQRATLLQQQLGQLQAGQTPLLGNLGIASNETTSILQGALSPQVDRMTEIAGILDAMREQERRDSDVYQRIADALENDAVWQARFGFTE